MAPGAPRYLSSVPGVNRDVINNPPRRVTLHAIINHQTIIPNVITNINYNVDGLSLKH